MRDDVNSFVEWVVTRRMHVILNIHPLIQERHKPGLLPGLFVQIRKFGE